MSNLKIHLNGSKASASVIKQMIHGLNDKGIRTEKGGYLFKAAADDDFLYLGIVPEFHLGQRNFHHTIELPGDPDYLLTGSLNPEGLFTILFVPKSKELSDRDKREYTELYRKLAVTLINKGLNKPGELDQVTRAMMMNLEAFDPLPASLEELSAYPFPESHNSAGTGPR